MKKEIFGFIVLFALFVFAILESHAILTPKKESTVFRSSSSTKKMQLTSTAFPDNGQLPQKFSCEGDGINPPLEFSGIPNGTKSLALIVEDPDAVSNPPFIHWVIFNLSPNVKFIKEGDVPSNAQEGMNSAGKSGYFAACPPAGSGIHHYAFRLYALDEFLGDMPDFTDKDMLIEAMHGHVLDQTVLTGLFQNSKDK